MAATNDDRQQQWFTGKCVTEDIRKFLKIREDKHSNSLFSFFVCKSVFKNILKGFCFFLKEMKEGYMVYIYNIVINNYIYNNKNEDCIDKNLVFKHNFISKLSYCSRNLQRLRGC